MIGLLAAFSVVALSPQNPQGVGELRALARDGRDSVDRACPAAPE